jgi:hypothetical protein
MARFRNKNTGIVVNVSECPAWGGVWEPIEFSENTTPDGDIPSESAEESADSSNPEEPASDAPLLVRPNNGASRGDWAAYAKALGFEVEDMKRDEIRDAIDAVPGKE